MILFLKLLKGLLLLVLILVVVFIPLIVLPLLQRWLLVPDDYFLYLTYAPYSNLVFVISFLLALRVVQPALFKGRLPWLKLTGNHLLAIVVPVMVYIYLFSFAVITPAGVVVHEFYHPQGTHFDFTDITHVQTGFVQTGRRRNLGQLYYGITLKNGRTIDLAHPSLFHPNPRYADATWQEWVDIDQLIMATGAKKTSSSEGSEYSPLAPIYLNRLLAVIENK